MNHLVWLLLGVSLSMIKKILKDSKGVGIFELIVSIAVGSIIMLTLTSMLTMVMTTNAKMKIEQRMENESYLISEKLKHNLSNLLKIEFSDVTAVIGGADDITIIRVDYCERYDGNIEYCSTDYDPNNLTTPPTPEPYFIKLSYHDEDGEQLPQLTFEIGEDGSTVERLHDNNIRLLEEGTQISISDGSANLPPYVWILTLVVNLQIEIHNEDSSISLLDPLIFETEIVFSRD